MVTLYAVYVTVGGLVPLTFDLLTLKVCHVLRVMWSTCDPYMNFIRIVVGELCDPKWSTCGSVAVDAALPWQPM